MKRCKSGFTLVELVIVVVVVGVLLLAVVPNFDQKSSRSKTARVQSDQRSLATAIESYMADLGTDIPSAYPTKNASAGQMTFRSYALLTTPIAYITAIPMDVFATRLPAEVSDGWLKGSRSPFIFYSGHVTEEETPVEVPATRRNVWVLVSVGPDGRNGVSLDGKAPASDPDPKRTPYSVDPCDKAVMLKAGTTVKAPTSVRAADGGAWTDVTYDGTNGTNSRGDILKFSSGVALPRFISR